MELLPELPVPQGPLLDCRGVTDPALRSDDPRSRSGSGNVVVQQLFVTYLRDFHPGLDYLWRQFCHGHCDENIPEPKNEEASWPG
eukprot:39178-Pyramimonas_sp.AAC.1